jgi:hypothetical protein
MKPLLLNCVLICYGKVVDEVDVIRKVFLLACYELLAINESDECDMYGFLINRKVIRKKAINNTAIHGKDLSTYFSPFPPTQTIYISLTSFTSFSPPFHNTRSGEVSDELNDWTTTGRTTALRY